MLFICLALRSALSGAQLCEDKIHTVIKLSGQPLSKQNNISLKVCLSLTGFLQNAVCISFGKKASPFMAWKISSLFFTTYFLDVKQYFVLKTLSVAIIQEFGLSTENVWAIYDVMASGLFMSISFKINCAICILLNCSVTSILGM